MSAPASDRKAAVLDEGVLLTEDDPAARGRTRSRKRGILETDLRRCLDREEAAVYLGVSADTLDRLIQADRLPIVKLPIERHKKTGRGVSGITRLVLVDVRDLDALVERSKERRT